MTGFAGSRTLPKDVERDTESRSQGGSAGSNPVGATFSRRPPPVVLVEGRLFSSLWIRRRRPHVVRDGFTVIRLPADDDERCAPGCSRGGRRRRPRPPVPWAPTPRGESRGRRSRRTHTRRGQGARAARTDLSCQFQPYHERRASPGPGRPGPPARRRATGTAAGADVDAARRPAGRTGASGPGRAPRPPPLAPPGRGAPIAEPADAGLATAPAAAVGRRRRRRRRDRRRLGGGWLSRGRRAGPVGLRAVHHARAAGGGREPGRPGGRRERVGRSPAAVARGLPRCGRRAAVGGGAPPPARRDARRSARDALGSAAGVRPRAGRGRGDGGPRVAGDRAGAAVGVADAGPARARPYDGRAAVLPRRPWPPRRRARPRTRCPPADAAGAGPREPDPPGAPRSPARARPRVPWGCAAVRVRGSSAERSTSRP